MDLVDLVVKCLPSRFCGGVIDVGCGDGDLIRELLAHLRPSQCVGVDLDTSNFVVGEGVHAVQADAVHLPLRSEVAEVVVARGLLHHVNDVGAVIREMARLVGPSGWLFISDGSRLDDRDFAAMNRELGSTGLPTERHPGLELDRLAKWISNSGLTVVEVDTSGEATFATPPFVSRAYSTRRLLVGAQRRQDLPALSGTQPDLRSRCY